MIYLVFGIYLVAEMLIHLMLLRRLTWLEERMSNLENPI